MPGPLLPAQAVHCCPRVGPSIHSGTVAVFRCSVWEVVSYAKEGADGGGHWEGGNSVSALGFQMVVSPFLPTAPPWAPLALQAAPEGLPLAGDWEGLAALSSSHALCCLVSALGVGAGLARS